MGVIIWESGMEFGEYDENQVFRIEASEQYTKNFRQNGCLLYTSDAADD